MSLRSPQVLNAVMIYSLASAVGQNFIYYTITQFNPLVLTTGVPRFPHGVQPRPRPSGHDHASYPPMQP